MKTAEEILSIHLNEKSYKNGITTSTCTEYILNAMEEYAKQFQPKTSGELPSDEEIEKSAISPCSNNAHHYDCFCHLYKQGLKDMRNIASAVIARKDDSYLYTRQNLDYCNSQYRFLEEEQEKNTTEFVKWLLKKGYIKNNLTPSGMTDQELSEQFTIFTALKNKQNG